MKESRWQSGLQIVDERNYTLGAQEERDINEKRANFFTGKARARHGAENWGGWFKVRAHDVDGAHFPFLPSGSQEATYTTPSSPPPPPAIPQQPPHT